MNRKNLSFLLLIFFMLGLSLAGCLGGNMNSKRVMIRIRNDSKFEIENFWLGAGSRGGATENTAYGAIPSGTNTDYKNIEPILANYRKMNMVINGVRYLDNIDPKVQIGVSELTPGWYTFAYDLVDGQPQLTLLKDEPPKS